MKHLDRLARLSSDFGFPMDPGQLKSLDQYHEWLESEAIVAGAIGPREAPLLQERHVADALTWLQPLADAPESVLDIGSGAGLPGIPLAIALPTTHVTLLDRAGRRCSLLRRAIRVLDLDNVTVREQDVARYHDTADVAVSRASLPPPQLLPHLRRLTLGVALVGGSTAGPVEISGYSTVEIGSRYLDSPRWMLIMRAS